MLSSLNSIFARFELDELVLSVRVVSAPMQLVVSPRPSGACRQISVEGNGPVLTDEFWFGIGVGFVFSAIAFMCLWS
jgi:hypothetical protein